MRMHDESMDIAILGLGTAVPPYRMDQEDTSRRLTEALSDAGYSDSSRWAKRIFRQCGVESRYTCEPNLLEPAANCRYFPSADKHTEVPSTSGRMAVYKRASVPLAAEAARKALADSGVQGNEITHLITVSCTGQFLPGLDAALMGELGLRPIVARVPLTFLGCAAGLKAVCLSKKLVAGQPYARALVVCVELCTLHIQPSSDREALYGASFFGDGASACVVGTPDENQRDVFLLGEERSVLLPGSAGEMIWEVGNHGFDLYLSPSIPRLIGEHVPTEVDFLLDGVPKPDLWAIHPGGRGIVDIMQDMFGLSDKQTSASRTILREYGNMSSATILFVLNEMKRLLREDGAGFKEGIALAFGPGVTAEMIRIAYSPSMQARNTEGWTDNATEADAYA
ncbi:type III polyketide synthase [Paenibacillus paeoniae]|uniref:Type III polyketide synthase n=1 Tax=Paenibacillus paeoniae TaxID=2292705 RepID=A0A371P7E3_9BACL|nr:type III polyketide synthase [Paenibacillus paeoniae]REK71376.1 type III polyketide synthase [Paenibacillus paeoniae]